MNENTTTSPGNTIAALPPETGSAWIRVEDQMPRTGLRVLVIALNGIHQWQTVAQYWPEKTIDATTWDMPPEDWWDEDEQVCTNPEACWMEAPIEGEEMHELSGVSHWMRLPPLPNNALSHAAPTTKGNGHE